MKYEDIFLIKKFFNHKLGLIGVGIFLIIGFFAVTADILAPYPWDYPGMLQDTGPTPFVSTTQSFTSPTDTKIFEFAVPPPNTELTFTGSETPDPIHFAVESVAQVPEDFDHARFIYAICPFNVLPVLDGIDFDVSLELDETQCVGLDNGGFMVQVEVNDNIVGNWTMTRRDKIEFADHLMVGERNNIRLTFADISTSTVKLVVNWSPITWLDGATPRQMEVNETILTRISSYGTITGWKYTAMSINELSGSMELKYGLPPFSWNEDGTRFHPLGTDLIGHDILTGLMYSARMALITGFLAMAIATAIGVVVGVISRYGSKVIDDQLTRFSAPFNSVPRPIMLFLHLIALYIRFYIIIFIIAMSYGLYSTTENPTPIPSFLIFGLTGWIGIVRVTRTQLLASGDNTSIDLKQVLFNALPVITIGIAEVMFIEAGLAFLGLGNPFIPTWGRMMQLSQQGLHYGAWWVFVFPALGLILSILAFILIGIGLKAALHSLKSEEKELPTVL